MATAANWDKAFLADSRGSSATRDRAFRTWNALDKFAKEKKWKLDPASITPKQMRVYLEGRAGVVSARCVQLEASHLRRAIAGSGRELGDVRDAKNTWSSARMGVPEGSRIGGKAAADLNKWDLAQPKMDKDIHAVTGLVSEIGLRCKEGIMAAGSLKEWKRELDKPESKERGCYLNITAGTKGGRPRFTFIPAERVEAVTAAVTTAQGVAASQGGNLIDAPDLKSALKRWSNCLARLDLTGTDSGHGLRRAWAQQQNEYYRNAGMDEKEALKRLSQDLGHGDGRGRWVANNYLLGGEGGGNGTD